MGSASSSTSVNLGIVSKNTLSWLSSLIDDTSPIKTSPPCPQNLCKLPGNKVILSHGS